MVYLGNEYGINANITRGKTPRDGHAMWGIYAIADNGKGTIVGWVTSQQTRAEAESEAQTLAWWGGKKWWYTVAIPGIGEDLFLVDDLPAVPGKYGATCIQCGIYAPHAVKDDKFVCWMCSNYPYYKGEPDDD